MEKEKKIPRYWWKHLVPRPWTSLLNCKLKTEHFIVGIFFLVQNTFYHFRMWEFSIGSKTFTREFIVTGEKQLVKVFFSLKEKRKTKTWKINEETSRHDQRTKFFFLSSWWKWIFFIYIMLHSNMQSQTAFVEMKMVIVCFSQMENKKWNETDFNDCLSSWSRNFIHNLKSHDVSEVSLTNKFYSLHDLGIILSLAIRIIFKPS